MADMQVQERLVSNDGQDYRGVTSTTQTTSDPVTGAATRRSSTRARSGRPLAARIVGLAAGIVSSSSALTSSSVRPVLPTSASGRSSTRSVGLWPPPLRHLQDRHHHIEYGDRLGGPPGRRRLRHRRCHRRQGGVDEQRSAGEAVHLTPAPLHEATPGTVSGPGRG